MRRNPRRAEVDPQHPQGWATSDRNGHIGNLRNMKWQHEWRGSTVVNTRVLVHEDELDIPQRQLGTLVIPADPPPLMNARPETYDIDEQPVSTRYTIGPNGLASQIRIIISSARQSFMSNRIVTTPGNILFPNNTTVVIPTPVPVFGFRNFTGSNLSRWSAAQAARAAGTRNATVLDWGDSTVAGFGATAGNINAALSSRMGQLAALLGNSSISSFFSDFNVSLATSGSTTLATFDGRRTTGSWIDNTDHGFGGPTQLSSASTPLTFTPTNSVDRFDLYYTTFPTFGTMSYQIDSGTVTNISQDFPSSVTKLTVSTTLGVHTLKIAQVAGAIAFVGAVAYNSAAKEFSLLNAGYCAATSNNLTDTTGGYPWLNLPMVTKLAPDLTIIEGGQINDWTGGIARATSIANLQTMITTAKLSGDVILTTANPSSATGTGIPYATQQGYVDDMIALAITNNIPCVDVWRLFGGTWEAANALGYNFDTVHPSGTGYGAIAGYLNTGLAAGFTSV